MKIRRVALICIVVVFVICISIGSYVLGTRQTVASNQNFNEIEHFSYSAVVLTVEVSALDAAYAEDMASMYSNVEKSELHQQYVEKWDALAKEYYDKLIAILDDAEKQQMECAYREWAEYVEQRLKMREMFLLRRFTTGSIVPVLLSDFECELHRAHAIDVQRAYLNLNWKEWQEHLPQGNTGDGSPG